MVKSNKVANLALAITCVQRIRYFQRREDWPTTMKKIEAIELDRAKRELEKQMARLLESV